MPDKRSHRGAHPEDTRLFDRSNWLRLREAVADMSWLLTRGYAEKSALKLVGDRFNLTQRQRTAIMRSACPDTSLARRNQHRIADEHLGGQTLLLDGYNILTTIEAALGGGVLLLGRDGCVRDMASMHGSYRKVHETIPALRLIGQTTCRLRSGCCVWYLDAPVSNSGRLKTVVMQVAQQCGWDWSVHIVPNPDQILMISSGTVVTADSAILDRCGAWFNLAPKVIETAVTDVWMVDLSVAKDH